VTVSLSYWGRRLRVRWLGRGRARGQTIVEVALVLPIFIFLLVAVIELGYWAAVNSAVHTASREAARFGSTVDDSGGTPNYLNCPAIRERARERVGPLVSLSDGQISIGYDTDGSPGPERTCGSATAAQIDRWNRIEVRVQYTYRPFTRMFGNVEMDVTNRRSIVK
jgi:hypothetical protein